MEKLIGRKISNSDYDGREWVADLINFDGPFLSLFRGSRGHDKLVMWVDCDARRNRWASFDVDRVDLREYFAERMTLRALVTKPASIVFFHTSSTTRKASLYQVSKDSFPASYLPDEDSLWDPSLATMDAMTLVQEKVEIYKLRMQSEDWYLEDLSKVAETYRQLYSFHYAVRYLARTAVRKTVATRLSKLAWKGGFSTVSWFRSLTNVTPSVHRLRLKELDYASPGFIALEALPAVTSDVAASLEKLVDSGNRDRADQLYKLTYAFLTANNLNGLDSRDFAAGRAGAVAELDVDGVREGVRQKLDGFLSLYGMGDQRDDLLSAGAEELSLLKAMLSYHRRAMKLADYIDDGILEVPQPDPVEP